VRVRRSAARMRHRLGRSHAPGLRFSLTNRGQAEKAPAYRSIPGAARNRVTPRHDLIFTRAALPGLEPVAYLPDSTSQVAMMLCQCQWDPPYGSFECKSQNSLYRIAEDANALLPRAKSWEIRSLAVVDANNGATSSDHRLVGGNRKCAFTSPVRGENGYRKPSLLGGVEHVRSRRSS